MRSNTNMKLAVLMALLFNSLVPAIVLHPETEPNLAEWTDRPDPDVLGRFGSTACFTVVAPNWILTTRHQIITPSTVVVAGTTYYCHYNNLWKGGPSSSPPGNADIQLIRLTKSNGEPAGLEKYVHVYDGTNEVSAGIIIGGFGDGRGGILQKSGQVYGYEWDRLPNTNQRWCTNIVEDTQDDSALGSLVSDIIISRFNEPGATTYEGTQADHDSGGGWFIKTGDEWKLAGLSRAIEGHYELGHEGDINYLLFQSWFRNAQNPFIDDPDYIDAVRVGSYAAWINDIITTEGDLTGDDRVNFKDFAVLSKYWLESCDEQNGWCEGADLDEPFGTIDIYDLAVISSNWLTGWGYD